MVKKLFVFFSLIIFLQFSVFSEEVSESSVFSEGSVIVENSEQGDNDSEVLDEEVNLKGKEFSSSKNFQDFIHSLDYVLDIGPEIFLNTESKFVSAPSPIYFPVSMGVLWPNYTFVSMQPTLSFFSMYYLWYENKALPAEIENRTVNALSFMFDLPLMFQLYMKKSRVQLFIGPSFLGRIGLLASGVLEGDSGFSGSASGDVKLINKWFGEFSNIFYVCLGGSFLFTVYEDRNLKIGPVAKIYVPLGGIASGGGFYGTIINLGMRISL